MTASNASTSQPLIVSIPHRLGRDEAKHRLDNGISRLRREYGALVTGLDYGWQADTLNFRLNIIWQTVSGRIAVLDDTVHIEIDLPWMLRLLTDTVRKQTRERALLMLEKSSG